MRFRNILLSVCAGICFDLCIASLYEKLLLSIPLWEKCYKSHKKSQNLCDQRACTLCYVPIINAFITPGLHSFFIWHYLLENVFPTVYKGKILEQGCQGKGLQAESSLQSPIVQFPVLHLGLGVDDMLHAACAGLASCMGPRKQVACSACSGQSGTCNIHDAHPSWSGTSLHMVPTLTSLEVMLHAAHTSTGSGQTPGHVHHVSWTNQTKCHMQCASQTGPAILELAKVAPFELNLVYREAKEFQNSSGG